MGAVCKCEQYVSARMAVYVLVLVNVCNLSSV